MFGMDLFDVIDLTDKAKIIMVSRERGAPAQAKYKIKNDVIQINSNYSFRIVDLSKEALTLHLILNFESKDVSVKGEARLLAMWAVRSSGQGAVTDTPGRPLRSDDTTRGSSGEAGER